MTKRQQRFRKLLVQHTHLLDQSQAFLARHFNRLARVAAGGPRPEDERDMLVACAACAYVVHGMAVADLQAVLDGMDRVDEL